MNGAPLCSPMALCSHVQMGSWVPICSHPPLCNPMLLGGRIPTWYAVQRPLETHEPPVRGLNIKRHFTHFALFVPVQNKLVCVCYSSLQSPLLAKGSATMDHCSSHVASEDEIWTLVKSV